MISPDVVFDLAKFILDMGVGEISLADSTGMGHPLQIEEMVSILQSMVGFDILTGLHLHNTENKGYANIYAGLRAGCNIIDTAFGGLGGCPFIKEATGNVATEDTVHMLEQMGIDTGIDIQKIGEVSREMATISGESLPGLLYKLPV
jgi:hydroxymethylglutaryl-CoA lyase